MATRAKNKKERKPFKVETKIYWEPGEIGRCFFKTPVGTCPNMAVWSKFESMENPEDPGEILGWVGRWNYCLIHRPDEDDETDLLRYFW